MCWKFWCCFGPGLGQDDDLCATNHHVVPPAKTTTTPHHHHPALAQRNDGGHYDHHHANGHNRGAPPLHHHHQQDRVAAEEDRKASNDLRRGHGYAASAAYVYSGPRGATTVTQAPSNATVVVADGEPGRRGGAHHFNFYPADHHSPTTTAPTNDLHRSVR